VSERPNFVFFIAAQFRYDLLGCAGHPVARTPHIDRLAAEGARFDRCYSIHPLCMPTRATWFTGLVPRAHGTRCNGIPLDPSLPTVPGALLEAGFRTHAIGKLHMNPWMPHRSIDADSLSPDEWPEARPVWDKGLLTRLPSPYYGFETVDFMGGNGHRVYCNYAEWLLAREPGARELMAPPPDVVMDFSRSVEATWRNRLPAELGPTSWAAERGEKFLADAAKSERPFFLWLSIPDPHPPYTASAPWCDMYRPEDMPMPTRREGELDSLPPHYRTLFEEGVRTAGRIAATNVPEDAHRRVAAMVCAMVSQFDAMVGRVVGALERLGLYENTVVAFLSDHGQMLGDHWMYSMPPCHLDGTLRVPSVWRAPGDAPRGRVCDALVSHLDFAPTVLDLAGVPVPEGRTTPEPEAPRQRPPWPGRSFVPLLAGTADRIQGSVIAENDEDYLGMRMRTLVTENHHFTIYAGEPYGELYDLRNDPGQLRNLWDDASARALKRDLHARLLHRLAETDSVLPRRLGHA